MGQLGIVFSNMASFPRSAPFFLSPKGQTLVALLLARGLVVDSLMIFMNLSFSSDPYVVQQVVSKLQATRIATQVLMSTSSSSREKELAESVLRNCGETVTAK